MSFTQDPGDLERSPRASGILGFLDLFSGGALARAAVLGLGIMPYITSSIIVQLLGTVIPKFAEWREQGAVGQRKLTQATRYLTVALALMQSSGLVFLLHSGQLFGSTRRRASTTSSRTSRAPHVLFIILTFTAGTAFVMWLGELITQRGIGQGMSILIFSNVVATLPLDVDLIKADKGWAGLVIIMVLVWLILLVAIVFVELGQRRIPVTFARRVQGRRMYGGQSTYIPLKVNQAGVIPIIFASSLLYIPVLFASVLPWTGRPHLDPEQPAVADRWRLPRRSTACSSSSSRSSTCRSASTPTSRPTRSASKAATSPASAPDLRPRATSRGS